MNKIFWEVSSFFSGRVVVFNAARTHIKSGPPPCASSFLLLIISLATSHHIFRLFNSSLSQTRYATKGGVFLSWPSVSCGLPGALSRCRKQGLPGSSRPFLGHLSRALGSAMAHPEVLFSPLLLHFGGSAKGRFSLLESMAHTFAQLGAGVLHNSPWCRHRLLRPALRYTSLHAQYCTIPPTHSFTSQLRTAAAAGKQNTPFHHISLPRRGTWTPAETRR